MVAKLLDEKKLPLETYLDVSDVDLQDVRSLLADRSLEDLEMLFRLMSHGLEEVAKSSVSKMLMDVLLIKMSTITEYVALDELNSLDQLQSNESEDSEPVSIPAATAAVSTPVVHSPPILKAAPKAVPLKEVDLPRWKLAVEYVKAHKPLFGSALENLGFDSARIDGVCLVITLLSTKETAFYREQLDRSQNLQNLSPNSANAFWV